MEQLRRWAESLGLAITTGDDNEIMRLHDDAVQFNVVEHHALLVIEAASIGDTPFVLGAVDTRDDAERMLALQLGSIGRHRAQMSRLEARQLPPGYVIEYAPTSTLWLSWFTGSAEFPDNPRGYARAFAFSVIERAPVEVIRESYAHPLGHPLFDAA